jgi:hypothetical protein
MPSVEDIDTETAWKGMKIAASLPEPDIVRFKQYLVAYCAKLHADGQPVDASQMELGMRHENFGLYLIAIVSL